MNKELYDKVLTLMAIDMAYEQEYGARYVDQKVFDDLLIKANVGTPNADYIESRMEIILNDLEKELLKS